MVLPHGGDPRVPAGQLEHAVAAALLQAAFHHEVERAAVKRLDEVARVARREVELHVGVPLAGELRGPGEQGGGARLAVAEVDRAGHLALRGVHPLPRPVGELGDGLRVVVEHAPLVREADRAGLAAVELVPHFLLERRHLPRQRRLRYVKRRRRRGHAPRLGEHGEVPQRFDPKRQSSSHHANTA